jgi:23S rRNA pseudouridine1911/1915/1917 synthase
MPFVQKKLFSDKKTLIIPFLCENLNLTSAEAGRLMDKRRVVCEGVSVAKKFTYIKGEVLVTVFEESVCTNLPFFTHRDFSVYEKPSGILVHPQRISAEHTLLDDIKAHFGKAANIVHRIDRETSGLVLTAHHKTSEKFFKRAFDEKLIDKSYFAYVHGKVERRYEVDAPILKFRDLSSRFFPVSKEGRESLTIIEPLRYDAVLDISLVRAIPISGRTHQIRIHLWHIGFPIVGEPLYGNPIPFREAYLEGRLDDADRVRQCGALRLMLHAQTLEFRFDTRYKIVSKEGFDAPAYLQAELGKR